MFTDLLNSWRILTLEAVIRSLPLFLIAGIVMIPLRCASASVRSYVWRLTLFGLLVLPVLPLALPTLEIPFLFHSRYFSLAASRPDQPTPTQPASIEIAADQRNKVSAYSPSVYVPGRRSQRAGETTTPPNRSALPTPILFHAATHSPARPDRLSLLLSWLQRNTLSLLFTVWICGGLLILTRTLMGLTTLFRLQRRAVSVGAELRSLGATLICEMGIRRPVRFVTASSDQGTVSPMTWGVLRPIVLLPHDADTWPLERLRTVLYHELAHIARNDWAIHLLTDAACILYWFHPLVWLLARQLRRENEQACDDRVLACGLNPSDYAAHLLEIARMRRHAGGISCAAISMAQPSTLEARIRALLDPRRSHRPLTRRVSLLTLCVFVLLLLPLASVRVAAHRALPSKSVSAQHAGNANHIVSSTTNKMTPEQLEQSESSAAQSRFILRARPVTAFSGVLTGRTQSPNVFDSSRSRAATVAIAPYHIASEAKYEMNNEAKYETNDEAKHEAPNTSAAQPEVIAWGKASHGLQAGLRSPLNRQRYAIGETVKMDYIVRNVGKEEITFDHEAPLDIEGTCPDITAVNGKPARTWGDPYLHSSARDIHTLKPGTSVVLGQTAMGVLPWDGRLDLSKSPQNLQRPQGEREPIVFVNAAPGRYKMRHLDTLYVHGEQAATVTLTTGELPLEIYRAQELIVWGPASGGLQAGLSFRLNSPGDRRQFDLGEEIHTDLFVRNFSLKPIQFQYQLNRDKFLIPRLIDANEIQLKPNWQNRTLEEAVVETVSLKPGDKICIAHPYFTIDSNYHQKFEPNLGDLSQGTWFSGYAGKYRVSIYADLVLSEGASHSKFAIVPAYTSLLSGELSFEVVKK